MNIRGFQKTTVTYIRATAYIELWRPRAIIFLARLHLGDSLELARGGAGKASGGRSGQEPSTGPTHWDGAYEVVFGLLNTVGSCIQPAAGRLRSPLNSTYFFPRNAAVPEH